MKREGGASCPLMPKNGQSPHGAALVTCPLMTRRRGVAAKEDAPEITPPYRVPLHNWGAKHRCNHKVATEGCDFVHGGWAGLAREGKWAEAADLVSRLWALEPDDQDTRADPLVQSELARARRWAVGYARALLDRVRRLVPVKMVDTSIGPVSAHFTSRQIISGLATDHPARAVAAWIKEVGAQIANGANPERFLLGIGNCPAPMLEVASQRAGLTAAQTEEVVRLHGLMQGAQILETGTLLRWPQTRTPNPRSSDGAPFFRWRGPRWKGWSWTRKRMVSAIWRRVSA
jgi:hypothetical protein